MKNTPIDQIILTRNDTFKFSLLENQLQKFQAPICKIMEFLYCFFIYFLPEKRSRMRFYLCLFVYCFCGFDYLPYLLLCYLFFDRNDTIRFSLL